jgi:protein TonB
MSYVDQRMGAGRITSIIMVAILHALLGYMLVTGLAYKVVKKAVEDLKTFDVNEEPPPPPEKPPPPPEKVDLPPPPVAPPSVPVIAPIAPPPIQTLPPPPTPAPPPPPPPPPPAPKVEPAKARANLASYVSDDDYPDSANRNREQGTTSFTLDVGPDGRVTGCSITASSGSSTLDSTTCRLMRSRARFTPARDSSGNPVSDRVSSRIRWVLPAD